MNVYIATSFSRRGAASTVANHFESAGHSITFKWWSEIELNKLLTEDRMTQAALDDIRGVLDADIVVVLLFPTHRHWGTMSELGVAIALGKPVVIWTSDSATFEIDSTIPPFWFHPNVCRISGPMGIVRFRTELMMLRGVNAVKE